MTISNELMAEVLARLRAAVVVADPTKRIRRDHRTRLPLDAVPAVHVVEGDENPVTESKGCDRRATLDFRVSIFVRSDEGSAEADPIKEAVMAALNPNQPGNAFPRKAVLTEGRITPITEIADNDALRIDMSFRFAYWRGDWTLGAS